MERKIGFLVLVLCLAFSLASCKAKTTGENENGKEEEITEAAKKYKIGEKFTLNKIQWTVVSVKKLNEIPKKIKDIGSKDEAPYKPKNGTFLVVNFKFKGSARNEPAGYNIDAIKAVDKDDKEYKNIEPSGAIDDYRMETNIPNLSFAMINIEEEKEYMEIYDIPKNAKGLKLIWLGFSSTGKVVTKVQVDLGL